MKGFFLLLLLMILFDLLKADDEPCQDYEFPCFETSDCCWPFVCLNRGKGFKCLFFI